MKILLVIIALVVVVAGVLLYIRDDSVLLEEEAVACTMEAKLCPDGSYVGRGGPNCEFAPCPTEATSTI
ncbi:MAG: hypothetical protein ACYCY6_02590 [Minisyncoccota bacterium]